MKLPITIKQIMNHTLARPVRDSLEQPKPTLNNNQHGQASIEFILTIAFTIGLSLLFIAQGLNMSKGYIAHYATFMAGRTFLTQEMSRIGDNGPNINEAKAKAVATFNNYNSQGLNLSETISFSSDQGDVSQLFNGVTLTYSERLSFLPIVGGNGSANFHSEALLGKEPTRTECMQSICSAMNLSPDCYDKEYLITIMDNGC